MVPDGCAVVAPPAHPHPHPRGKMGEALAELHQLLQGGSDDIDVAFRCLTGVLGRFGGGHARTARAARKLTERDDRGLKLVVAAMERFRDAAAVAVPACRILLGVIAASSAVASHASSVLLGKLCLGALVGLASKHGNDAANVEYVVSRAGCIDRRTNYDTVVQACTSAPAAHCGAARGYPRRGRQRQRGEVTERVPRRALDTCRLGVAVVQRSCVGRCHPRAPATAWRCGS